MGLGGCTWCWWRRAGRRDRGAEMNVVVRQRMTLEQFLAWEERQELRYEFDGFQPVAMTGGTVAHSLIQGNVLSALVARLRGKPCRAFGSHLKIEVAGSIRYPDAFVVCSPVAANATVVKEPVVIFEVLSPSTSGTDRIIKAREYRETSSVQRYVILEQRMAAATVFSRDGGDWVARVIGEGGILEMPEIGVSLPLAEIYEGLEIPENPDDA